MSRSAVRHFPRRTANAIVSAACMAGMFAAVCAAHGQAFYKSGATAYTTGGTPTGVAVVDLNRDGKPDTITANGSNNQIAVVLSNPTGYAVTTYGTGGGTTPVAVGVLPNFAKSGQPAVGVVEQGTSEVAIYTVSDAGVLTLDTTYGTGAKPTAIAVGDFNNDGIPDMAISYSTGVTVLLGSETGAFTVPTDGAVGVGTKLSAIAAGHFNGAQYEDLAVTDQSANTVTILTGTGGGNFTVGASYATGTTPESIGVGDFTQNGKLDIVVGNYAGDSISLFLGNGNGTFSAQTAYGAGGSVQSLTVADVNNDGIPDVVVTNPSTQTLGVLVGNGTSTNTFQTVLNPALSSPYGIATLDVNRDGKPDVAVTQGTAGSVSFLTNNTLLNSLPGGRNFLAATQMGPGNMADAVATADFNGDGFPDVATAYLEDGKVGVMLGKGNGTFGAQTLYSVGKHPYSIAVADLNHDGSPDIVVANEADGTVSVLLNNNAGGFNAAVTYKVGTLPTGVAIGDLNGDGYPDLAVTNYGGNDVSILINNGSGTFAPGSTPTLAAGTNPYNVVIADFRGNGINDVAVTNFKSGNVEVYLGNGDGSFQSGTTFAIPALAGGGGSAPVGAIEPSSIAVGDFNRDGNLDFAVGTAGGNTIAIFLGNGSGGFTSSAVQTLNFPVSIAVGDVNGDGIPDIVNVNPNYNNVTVLLGNGDGTFTSRWQFPTAATTAPNTVGAQPWGVALADFNQDGKLDIVTANTVARINLTIPAYQPAAGAVLSPASPNSASVLLNSSGTNNVVTLDPNGNNVPSNTPIKFTSQVTSALGGVTATGAVTFEDTNGSPISNAPVPLAAGTASVSLQNLGSGSHIISGLYSGDVNYQPNTTVAGGQQVVIVAGTPVTLSISPTTMPYQGNFQITITVTGNVVNKTPTGTVSLLIYTPQGFEAFTNPADFDFTSCNGDVCKAVVQVYDPSGVLTPGSYIFYATYNPGNYPAGTSANEILTVTAATPDITLDCALAPGKSHKEVCYSEVTNPANTYPGGNDVVETGNVTFSLNGGAAQTEPIEYQTVTTTAGSTEGYYAVQTYTAITGFFSETATFPAGQGGGTLGAATITGSFCSRDCGHAGPTDARNIVHSSLRGEVPANLAGPDRLHSAVNDAALSRRSRKSHIAVIVAKPGSGSSPVTPIVGGSGGGGITIQSAGPNR